MKEKDVCLSRRELAKLIGATALLPQVAVANGHLLTQDIEDQTTRVEKFKEANDRSVLIICELGAEDITLSNMLSKLRPNHNFLRDYFFTGPRDNGISKYQYVSHEGRIELMESNITGFNRKEEIPRRLNLLREHPGRYLISAFPHEVTNEVVRFVKEYDFEIIWLRASNRQQQYQLLKNYFLSTSLYDWSAPYGRTDKSVTQEQWENVEIDWGYAQQSRYRFHELMSKLPKGITVWTHMGSGPERVQSYVSQLKLESKDWEKLDLWGNSRFFPV